MTRKEIFDAVDAFVWEFPGCNKRQVCVYVCTMFKVPGPRPGKKCSADLIKRGEFIEEALARHMNLGVPNKHAYYYGFQVPKPTTRVQAWSLLLRGRTNGSRSKRKTGERLSDRKSTA